MAFKVLGTFFIDYLFNFGKFPKAESFVTANSEQNPNK